MVCDHCGSCTRPGEVGSVSELAEPLIVMVESLTSTMPKMSSMIWTILAWRMTPEVVDALIPSDAKYVCSAACNAVCAATSDACLTVMVKPPRVIASAAGEKLGVMLTMDYLRREAAAGRRDDFEKYLAAVPNVPPPESDRLD